MKSITDRIDEIFSASTPEEAEAWMIAKRDAARAGRGGGTEDCIALCNELGSFYRERGRYGESLENFEEALAKTEALNGTRQSGAYATILVNIAGTYRYRREFDRALACYTQAEEIFTALGMREGYGYASLLNNWALALLDMGEEPAAALGLAERAHAIVNRMHAGQAQEAVSFVNMASIAHRVGDLGKADGYARRAIGIYDSLGVVSGHYPAAVNMVAVVALERGDARAALAGFRRAAELTKANFGENRDYASALANISRVHGLLGDEDAAARYAARADEVRRGLG